KSFTEVRRYTVVDERRSACRMFVRRGRDQTEARHPKMCRNLVRRLDAVIQVFESEDETDRDDSPDKDGQEKISAGVRSSRAARYFGSVDDPYVGRSQLLRKARFLHSLEQRFEHLAVAG